MWELFFISKIRLLNSIEEKSNIKGISKILEDNLDKYHSPLNNSPLLIKPKIVEWLELINLAKVKTEGKITCKIL